MKYLILFCCCLPLAGCVIPGPTDPSADPVNRLPDAERIAVRQAEAQRRKQDIARVDGCADDDAQCWKQIAQRAQSGEAAAERSQRQAQRDADQKQSNCRQTAIIEGGDYWKC